MSISVKCPNGHKLVLRDEHAGKKVRCPKCQIIMRAPRERWEVAPTLSEASSVELPVLMCAGGHRFLVLSDHDSDQVRCPLCDQPAGIPVSATILTANGQTIVTEAQGVTPPMAVAAFSGSQASVLADTASTALPPTAAPVVEPADDFSTATPAANVSMATAQTLPAVETIAQQVPASKAGVAVPSPNPNPVSENPYETPGNVEPAHSDSGIEESATHEKLWPLFLLVGGAAATLVGIAFWVKQSAGE